MPRASEGALQYKGKVPRKLRELGAQRCSTQAQSRPSVKDELPALIADCRPAIVQTYLMHLAGQEGAGVSQITHRARVTPV